MKILCPAHKDSTPSLEVYSEYSFCFVCGYRVKNTELGVVNEEYSRKEPEKIEDSIQRIQNLPIKQLRGLEFPYDSSGFYILWPNKDFYKKRYFSGNQRYSGPKGTRPPLFLYQGSRNHIVAIEGEINAITAKKVCEENITICSPGAATNFTRFVSYLATYKKITLVLDYDAPGVVYGTETKEQLLKLNKHVRINFVTTDYNDLLQSSGINVVREQFRKDIYG